MTTDRRTRPAGPPPSPVEPGRAAGGQARQRRPSPGDVLGSSAVLSVLAVLVALLVAAVLIAATDPGVTTTVPYLLGRPGDTTAAVGRAVGGAYLALFEGGVYDLHATDVATGVRPLLDSLGFATPLIAAGLGIALGFRTGLFNIGGQGQILISGAVAGWIGFAVTLPAVVHLVIAVAGGLVAGAAWAGISGSLKARTGAHEVITTIMLNYIAIHVLDYALHSPVFRAPGSNNPKSPAEMPTAVLPRIPGTGGGLNSGFLLVLGATVLCWWLLNRSSLGFKFRAVGENPAAARTAGIDVGRITVLAMVASGALVGLAGVYQVLGQTTTGFSTDFDAGIGFNAITVALLGRSRPWGVFWAGILFGVFQAGGYAMQAFQGIAIDIVAVVQSIIVLFIAAPPLVRWIFRLPSPSASARRKAVNA